MTIDGANIIFRYPFNIDDIDDCVQFIKSEFENMKIEALSCVVVLRKTKMKYIFQINIKITIFQSVLKMH